jgi:hypothetical protein
VSGLTVRRVAAWGIAASWLVASLTAWGHPLGTSSVNRYLDLRYEGEGRFRVAYLLDLAEGPAYAEIDALDANHDGAITPVEQQRYLDSRLPVLVATCVVEIDGERVTPTIVASHLDTTPGEGGLETLRIAAELRVEGRAPSGGHPLALHVHDDGFAGLPGWREIHAEDATTPDASVSRTGSDAGGTPARVVDAGFSFQPRVSAFSASPRRMGRWAYGLGAAASTLLLASIVMGLRRLSRRRA